jgi:hypothetical protein
MLAASLANPALAAVSAYGDKAAFQADSGATQATVPYTVGSGTHTFGSVAFAAPVQAFGFEFVEPQFDPNVNASFVDSTFTVTLRQDSTAVGSLSFNAPRPAGRFGWPAWPAVRRS